MNNYLKMLSVAGIASIPQLASAAGPSLSDIFVNSGIAAAGYADASYVTAFHKTGAAVGTDIKFHQFDTDGSTFSVNQAALTLSYLPTSGFGALVNLIAGDDAKAINSNYGASETNFALTQAFVQYAVGNLTVIGGRFVTLAGAEVIDDTKNLNVSRSLLFTNLEPLVHTGLRASYKVNDMFSGTLGVNNSVNGNALDQDKHKTIEFGGAFTPTSAISVAVADYYGLDGHGTGATTKSNYLDLVASWQATSALQFVINGDYVRKIYNSGNGSMTGTGVAAYASYQITDQIKASLRAETMYLKTAGANAGSATGVPALPPGTTLDDFSARVQEITATIDYAPTKYFDLLAEGRIDYGSAFGSGTIDNGEGTTAFGGSTGPFLGGKDDSRKSQPEILLKAIFKFGTPTGS